jgi:hypothetical protein
MGRLATVGELLNVFFPSEFEFIPTPPKKR